MNIDLLWTDQKEPGLVSDGDFGHPVAGVMYDMESGQLTLEFGDADPLELNIPAASDAAESLSHTRQIQIGVIGRGMISENRQVPLMLLNDPFGGGNAGRFASPPRQSVTAFESFMKRCVSGQPVHRDDLGDDRHAGSVLGGVNPAVLQFAPHLARQKTMEASPHLAPQGPAAPGMAPGGGGGGGGMAATRRIQQPRRTAPEKRDEEE